MFRCFSQTRVAASSPDKASIAAVARMLKSLNFCPSSFEQLCLIGYLRDFKGDGRRKYLHVEFGESEIDCALRQVHLSVFGAWLGMNTAQQLADMRNHLQDPEDAALVLNSLVVAAKAAIPPEAAQHEKDLFVHQVELIMAVLYGRDEERLQPVGVSPKCHWIIPPPWWECPEVL